MSAKIRVLGKVFSSSVELNKCASCDDVFQPPPAHWTMLLGSSTNTLHGPIHPSARALRVTSHSSEVTGGKVRSISGAPKSLK